MKITHSISIILAVCLVLITVNYGECGLVLTEGESYTFEFSSLPYHSDYSEETFIFGRANIAPTTPIRPQFIFSVYEDTLNELPIKSGTSGIDPDFGLQSIFYFEITELAPWQDFQGIFYIEVITGEIELEAFVASTVIDNHLYKQTFTIPIPNSFLFSLSGILLIYIVRSAKKENF